MRITSTSSPAPGIFFLRLNQAFWEACAETYKVCSSGNPQDITVGIDGLATLSTGRDGPFYALLSF